MPSQAGPPSPERPQTGSRTRSPLVPSQPLSDLKDIPLSQLPLSELKAQMEMTMGEPSTATRQRPTTAATHTSWASTPNARPAAGGKTYTRRTRKDITTDIATLLQVHAPVDPYEPPYEPLDLHSDVAHELRLQCGVVGRVHSPKNAKKEKVHLGPYLRSFPVNFNVPPSEQVG